MVRRASNAGVAPGGGWQKLRPGNQYQWRAMALSRWRYDTVYICVSFPGKVSGRLKHYINAFGEEVIVDNTG